MQRGFGVTGAPHRRHRSISDRTTADADPAARRAKAPRAGPYATHRGVIFSRITESRESAPPLVVIGWSWMPRRLYQSAAGVDLAAAAGPQFSASPAHVVDNA